MSGHEFVRRERFYQDRFGKFRADAEAGVADLADKIRLLAQKPNSLLLAETHFAEPMGNFGRGGKLFDPTGGARVDLAERTDERLSTRFNGAGG
jgi:hypothetical protein